MKTYKLKEIQNQQVLIHSDGNPVECIYKNPVVLPHPNIQGQMILKQTICGDRCPCFTIYPKDHSQNFTDGKQEVIELSCTQTTIIVQEDNTIKPLHT